MIDKTSNINEAKKKKGWQFILSNNFSTPVCCHRMPDSWSHSFCLQSLATRKNSIAMIIIDSFSLSLFPFWLDIVVYVRKDSLSDDFLVVVQSRKWHGRIKPYHDSWERNQSRTSQIDRQQAYLSSNGKYYHSIRKRVGLMTPNEGESNGYMTRGCD